MDGRIVLGQTLVKIFDPYVPGIDRAVDERRVGSVAERIRVDDRRLMNKFAGSFKSFDEIFVAVFAEAALQLRNRLGKGACIIGSANAFIPASLQTRKSSSP